MKLIVLSLILAITTLSNGCGIPPKFWCDSAEIAERCGVLMQCQDFYINSSPVVQVDLYYEALCPFCRDFITSQLYPTWTTLSKTGIFNTNLVPYGNAHETSDPTTGAYKYECQHGPDECTLNAVENCVMHYANNKVESYLPVINCIEASESPMTDAEKCVTKGGLSWAKVEGCANGTESNKLLHDAAVRTGRLDPPHKYVPWIVVNGAHSDEMQNAAQENLLKFVCDAYKGKKPAECAMYASSRRSFMRTYA